MIRDFTLSFSQLSDPRLWKPILWATILSLGAIFITILIGGAFIFRMVDSFSNNLSGWMSWTDGWLEAVAVIVGTFLSACLAISFSPVYTLLFWVSLLMMLSMRYENNITQTLHGSNHLVSSSRPFLPCASLFGVFLFTYWHPLYCSLGISFPLSAWFCNFYWVVTC